jgi:hypothetical protein
LSYFICGFKADIADCNALEKIFVDIVPSHIRNDRFWMEGRSTYLAIYGNKKVIKNVVISDDKQGSWLVVIGTPLVVMQDEQQKLSLLADFLRNPAYSLSYTIDGNFAVLAYDAPRDRLIVATDFNNTTPIFYTVTPNGVFFSSHELPLARFSHPELDPFGFCQSIQLGVTWNSYTRFRNIYKMLPCQISIVDDNKKLHTERYWRPQDETIWSGSFEDHIEKWGSLLSESVWKFYECSNQKPVMADFTAGEDARLILAQCHALGIPFKSQVTGLPNDIDVEVAKRAAKKAGFDLIVRDKHAITAEQILANALNISLNSDAYLEFFKSCSDFATDTANPLDDYSVVKYGGFPGGEAYRGSYYLRGKAVFPSRRSSLDYKFFTRMKYLLDYHPSLLIYSDDDFLQEIYKIVQDNLEDVRDFPVGTQIDHMLRVFQTCLECLKYKNPLYLPFATNQMTRSIYGLSPRYKRGGRLTKAYTEVLFPELAFVKTQNGVPTIRKTMLRLPLFVPEFISTINKILSGALSRHFKWKQANKSYFNMNLNAPIFTTLLNTPPYCNWLSSSRTMISGQFYNPEVVNPILSQAKAGSCRYVPILGRIINQELAFRWVYREELS